MSTPMKEGGNPLKTDQQLKDMLVELENIKQYRKFKGWKSSFLGRFESFLNSEGFDKADADYVKFGKGMDKMTKHMDKVDVMVQKGDLCNEKVSVKGRMALNEMCKNLTDCCEETEKLLPSTGSEERKRGYTKFHLGAVLVRDGFSEYDRMKRLNDVMVELDTTLSEVADRQQLELFEWYSKKFKKFCDVMADLGLYEVMLACRRFAIEPEEEEESEPEPEPEPPEFILFIDCKTANVFEVDREVAFEKGCITRVEGSEKQIVENCKSGEQRELIRTKLKEHATLGVATMLVVQKMVNVDNEHTKLEDPEKVSSMWGVQLKSRNKKKKGEELFFLDYHTGAVGEMDRAKTIKLGIMTEFTNEFDKLDLKEAEHGAEAREALIEKIRQTMGIRLDQ